MMEALAILVLGPESSGTRLVTECFCRAGCFGDSTHEQRLDHEPPRGRTPLVWRRSVPHNRKPLDLPALLKALTGYDVRAVVTVRDRQSTILSHLRVGHSSTEEEAARKIEDAHRSIFRALDRHGIPFLPLAYEALVYDPATALRSLAAWSGLPLDGIAIDLHDGNARYRMGVSHAA